MRRVRLLLPLPTELRRLPKMGERRLLPPTADTDDAPPASVRRSVRLRRAASHGNTRKRLDAVLAGLRVPPISLPRLNGGQQSPVHPASMSRQQLDIINQIDGWIFAEFGYPMR